MRGLGGFLMLIFLGFLNWVCFVGPVDLVGVLVGAFVFLGESQLGFALLKSFRDFMNSLFLRR